MKRDKDIRDARQMSYSDTNAGVHGTTLRKKSRSRADLDLIESVSNTFSIIMSQLTEMKQINKSMGDHIRNLSESKENFAQTTEEGKETIVAKEENNSFQDDTSGLSKRKDNSNDEEIVKNSIPEVLWMEEDAMEDEFDEVFEEDAIDESNVDWWQRTNHRLSLKKSSIEFDFGLMRSLQGDQAVRNFVSVASLSTIGSVEKDYAFEIENMNNDTAENNKSSFICEDIVRSEEDSVSSISTKEYKKCEDISLMKNNMKYLLDKLKTEVEVKSLNETGCQEHVLNSALSTKDIKELVFEDENQLIQKLFFNGDLNNTRICHNEVKSIFGKYILYKDFE